MWTTMTLNTRTISGFCGPRQHGTTSLISSLWSIMSRNAKALTVPAVTAVDDPNKRPRIGFCECVAPSSAMNICSSFDWDFSEHPLMLFDGENNVVADFTTSLNTYQARSVTTSKQVMSMMGKANVTEECLQQCYLYWFQTKPWGPISCSPQSWGQVAPSNF